MTTHPKKWFALGTREAAAAAAVEAAGAAMVAASVSKRSERVSVRTRSPDRGSTHRVQEQGGGTDS